VAAACSLAVLCGLLALAPLSASARSGDAAKGNAVAKKSIIGGQVADPAAWPFAAGLLFDGSLGCGGSVLSATKVLTAAHCAIGFDISRMSVVTGRANLADPSVGQVHQLTAATVHPEYESTGRYDIAVLTLATPTTAAPVALAANPEANTLVKPGKRLSVAGWGSQKPAGGNLSNVLKKVNLRVLRPRNCLFTFGFDLFIPQTMVCAQGTKKIGKKKKRQFTSACRGDSGGPVVASTPAGVRQVAVVSFGPRKCGRVYPAVYAKVAPAGGFIASAMAAP
jgi:secreted trypsin-like serine protease